MGIIAEFKEFALKGNVVDLAIGVIIGAAFGKIVDSLVTDVIMPIVGILIGGRDFSKMSLEVGDAKLMYGKAIQASINFLSIALLLFFILKMVNKLQKKKPEKPA
jgi:large conductance mechanosensitive channel